MIQFPTATYRHIGRLFRLARSVRGLTLREAAKATSIRVVELSAVELGHRLPADKEAERMADAYQIPFKQLPGAAK